MTRDTITNISGDEQPIFRCPWCGMKPVLRDRDNHVRCHTKGCIAHDMGFQKLSSWNTRALT